MSALCLWTAPALTGCAGKDSVLFVTTTTIGLDADTRPPNVNIGYDRYEGYIGPAYSTGAVPPVFARIESNLKIFEPEVRQVYATGDAARLVTVADTDDLTLEPKQMFTDSRKRMFFGTSANIGLRVTFTGEVPESVTLGYKRKEFSFIPLGSEAQPDGRAIDKYASVIAAIDMGVKIPNFRETGLGVSQFFATGEAAENVAMQPAVRQRFAFEADQALKRYECEYGPDEASDQLQAKLDSDEAFRGQLAGWLAAEGVPLSVTSFIGCDSYAEKRQEAVDELL